ncbi:hypothetical protein BXZ70DRAFT_477846 [Cristinia sonorae]|uniref:Uncharacterized protein n=1 Tax=Cristinia sonorae TaxID=1940300 RepID=A0A8K0XLS0_9AGAR|nr:hypothetical protein BXZ70DRAFT_477846 [Cristinia sonorae]
MSPPGDSVPLTDITPLLTASKERRPRPLVCKPRYHDPPQAYPHPYIYHDILSPLDPLHPPSPLLPHHASPRLPPLSLCTSSASSPPTSDHLPPTPSCPMAPRLPSQATLSFGLVSPPPSPPRKPGRALRRDTPDELTAQSLLKQTSSGTGDESSHQLSELHQLLTRGLPQSTKNISPAENLVKRELGVGASTVTSGEDDNAATSSFLQKSTTTLAHSSHPRLMTSPKRRLEVLDGDDDDVFGSQGKRLRTLSPLIDIDQSQDAIMSEPYSGSTARLAKQFNEHREFVIQQRTERRRLVQREVFKRLRARAMALEQDETMIDCTEGTTRRNYKRRPEEGISPNPKRKKVCVQTSTRNPRCRARKKTRRARREAYEARTMTSRFLRDRAFLEGLISDARLQAFDSPPFDARCDDPISLEEKIRRMREMNAQEAASSLQSTYRSTSNVAPDAREGPRQRQSRRASLRDPSWTQGEWTAPRALQRYTVVSDLFDKTKFSPSDPLSFEDIPWPVLKRPGTELGDAEYVRLVEKSHKRFHPDRWRARKIWGGVDEEAKRGLESSVNVVAQALTPLWRRSRE